MGTTHALGWAATPATIAGIAAETVAEAAPLCAQVGCPVYPDLQAMLPEVDVVDICTPTHLHDEMVLQAAAAGKGIVCEKPLALTVERARRMLAACRQAGIRLLVGHVVRFFPEYAQAKAAVERGEIGRPGVVRLHRGSYRPKKPVGNWFLDESKSGGILLDLMIHDFDYARWVAGEVTRVYARKITVAHPDAPVDYGLAILTHQNGTISHIAGAWAYPPPTFRTSLEIAGDRGLIQFDSDDTVPIRNLIMKSHGDAPDVALPSSPLAESPYITQIKEFYQALHDDRPARVSAEDGLAAVQIARAAVASAETGEAVTLEPLEEVRA
jgi:predicted dehydrogenase